MIAHSWNHNHPYEPSPAEIAQECERFKAAHLAAMIGKEPPAKSGRDRDTYGATYRRMISEDVFFRHGEVAGWYV